ncbi:MAG TPA: phosphoenolpyruvate--protein phosphotransferase [Firmicutes bacterium]|jgi:phosphoenolpyruvate-protein phosphotransferase (PTS system enzyme I)|nr:phosphoenolpyruvate--protein phosphotransferase [Bacillota bacterium]
MKGIPVSAGIAIAKAVVINEKHIQVPQRNIVDVQAEIRRFTQGVGQAKLQIIAIQKAALEETDHDRAAIFGAHLLMLEDPEFLKQIESKMREEKVNAEYALQMTVDSYMTAFQGIEDPYLRERSADLKDVSDRMLRILLCEEKVSGLSIHEDSIVVAHDLSPSDTAQLDRKYVMGFITELGGPTSHTAIIARTLDIPAVVGLPGVSDHIQNGDQVIIDGESGEVLLNPAPPIINEYRDKQRSFIKMKQDLLQLKDAPVESKDGRKIQLAVNIGHLNDIKLGLENGAAGIGLFRSEFLFMEQKGLPSEDLQFEAYRKALALMDGKPVIIRTLDIGGDKKLDYLPISQELNPFLGYRALRLCLDRQDIFKTQLRAILRASMAGNLKVMFPMVSGLEELRKARQIANEVQQELIAEGIDLNSNIEWGIMIEIPSAAVISDILAPEVDFFSLGTNDLIQYTLAVDRTNEKVAALYEPYHPAVLRLIKMVAQNAHQAGKWVGICGEMASDIQLLPVLIGLGLDELSVGPSAVLKVKKAIRSLDFQRAQIIAKEALQFKTAAEVKHYLTDQSNISEKGEFR